MKPSETIGPIPSHNDAILNEARIEAGAAPKGSSFGDRTRAMLTKTQGTILIVAVIVFLLGTASLALVTTGGQATTIAWGDTVEYRVTVFDEHGNMIFVTAPEPDAHSGSFSEDKPVSSNRTTWTHHLAPSGQGNVNWKQFSIDQFLLGNGPGDIIHTPLLAQALGGYETYALPRQFDPMPQHFTMDLAKLYAEDQINQTLRLLGPRSVIQSGASVSYGYLQLRVLNLEASQASVEIVLPDSGVVYSPAFGFNLTLSLERDEIIPAPSLSIGEVFSTRGCELPGLIVPPGVYGVVSINETNILVREHPSASEIPKDATLRFVFEIISVEKPRPAGMVSAFVHQIAPN